MFGIGGTEWVVIGIVLLIAVGPHRLPKLIKTVVRTYRELRRAVRELRSSSGLDDIIRDEELRELRELRNELKQPLHVPPAKRQPNPAPAPKPVRALSFTERTREDPPEGVDLAELREAEDDLSDEEREQIRAEKEAQRAAEEAVREAKIAAAEGSPRQELDPAEHARVVAEKEAAAREERRLIDAKIAAAQAQSLGGQSPGGSGSEVEGG